MPDIKPTIATAYTTAARAITLGLSQRHVWLKLDAEYQGQPGIMYRPEAYEAAREAAAQIREPEPRRQAEALLKLAKDAADATLLAHREHPEVRERLAYRTAFEAIGWCSVIYPSGNPFIRQRDTYRELIRD